MQNANSTVAGTAATTAQDTQIGVEEENSKAFIFDTGTSLSDIVDAINEVGASAADMVAILEESNIIIPYLEKCQRQSCDLDLYLSCEPEEE